MPIYTFIPSTSSYVSNTDLSKHMCPVQPESTIQDEASPFRLSKSIYFSINTNGISPAHYLGGRAFLFTNERTIRFGFIARARFRWTLTVHIITPAVSSRVTKETTIFATVMRILRKWLGITTVLPCYPNHSRWFCFHRRILTFVVSLLLLEEITFHQIKGERCLIVAKNIECDNQTVVV